MSDHSEMKQYIEQRLARGLDTPELDVAKVLEVIFENEQLKKRVRVRNAMHSSECTAMHEVQERLIDERDKLKAELERVKALNHQQFGDAIRKNAEVDRLKIKVETIRCLLGSLVPADEDLDLVIDAAIRYGERS